MEIQESASKWLWTKDSNTLVCNIEENVGAVTHMVNMVKDLIENAT